MPECLTIKVTCLWEIKNKVSGQVEEYRHLGEIELRIWSIKRQSENIEGYSNYEDLGGSAVQITVKTIKEKLREKLRSTGFIDSADTKLWKDSRRLLTMDDRDFLQTLDTIEAEDLVYIGGFGKSVALIPTRDNETLFNIGVGISHTTAAMTLTIRKLPCLFVGKHRIKFHTCPSYNQILVKVAGALGKDTNDIELYYKEKKLNFSSNMMDFEGETLEYKEKARPVQQSQSPQPTATQKPPSKNITPDIGPLVLCVSIAAAAYYFYPYKALSSSINHALPEEALKACVLGVASFIIIAAIACSSDRTRS